MIRAIFRYQKDEEEINWFSVYFQRRMKSALKLRDFKSLNYGRRERKFLANFSNKTFFLPRQIYKLNQLFQSDREQLTRAFNWWSLKRNSTWISIFVGHDASISLIASRLPNVRLKFGKNSKSKDFVASRWLIKNRTLGSRIDAWNIKKTHPT